MSLYLKYFKVHFKSELQYKLSFIMSFIAQFFVFFGYYFTIICLFDKFSNIKGFTICETFFRGVDQFDDLIISGNFDRLIIRPRNILLQVFCEQVSLIKFSRFLQSIIVLIIAVYNVDIEWNA